VVPKYRKWIVRGELRDFVAECMKEIAVSNEFEIEEMQIAEDHIHIFFGFPPKCSISTVVKSLKGHPHGQYFRDIPK
jgi:putative transposase